jgi:phosphoserine phosphatase
VLVAFDVDSTLIDEYDEWIDETCEVAQKWYGQGHDIMVWSGGGEGYARVWGRRLAEQWNLEVALVAVKGDPRKLIPLPDVAYDDVFEFLAALAERGTECWHVTSLGSVVRLAE